MVSWKGVLDVVVKVWSTVGHACGDAEQTGVGDEAALSGFQNL